MAVLDEFLPHEALLGIVPNFYLHASRDAVMRAILRLAGHGDLLRGDVLQEAVDLFARVTIQERHRLIAEFGVR